MDWAVLIGQLGLPTVVLIAIGYYGLRGVRWTGDNVVLPLTKAAIAYLQTLAEQSKKQTAALQQLAQAAEGILTTITPLLTRTPI